jgi:hypothetical protein
MTHQARHREIWVPRRMAQGGRFCDTYAAKRSFCKEAYDDMHANAHNMM